MSTKPLIKPYSMSKAPRPERKKPSFLSRIRSHYSVNNLMRNRFVYEKSSLYALHVSNSIMLLSVCLSVVVCLFVCCLFVCLFVCLFGLIEGLAKTTNLKLYLEVFVKIKISKWNIHILALKR